MDRITQQQLARLEKTLNDSVRQHVTLLALLERQRDAFRRGDAEGLAEGARRQNVALKSIGDLERLRTVLVAELSRVVAPDAEKPLRMLDLAERLDEPARSRLLIVRGRLIDAMRRVQEQTSVLRRAGDAMISHVNGLIRTIGTVTRGGSAYGLTGRTHPQPAALRTINLTG